MELIIQIVFVLVILLIVLFNIALRIVEKEMSEEKNDLTGFEVARIVADNYGNEEVHIIKKNGKFLDHFNSERNVIKLSPEAFDGNNLYAAYLALSVAITTSQDKKSMRESHRIASFLVLLSYIMIIIGSFISNFKIVNLGFLLFILSFIIEMICVSLFNYEKEELDNIKKIVKDEKLLSEEFKEENLVLLNAIYIATLPYSFIKYFR